MTIKIKDVMNCPHCKSTQYSTLMNPESNMYYQLCKNCGQKSAEVRERFEAEYKFVEYNVNKLFITIKMSTEANIINIITTAMDNNNISENTAANILEDIYTALK